MATNRIPQPRYDIRIKGSGTQEDIVAALQALSEDIKSRNVKTLDGAELEDRTLMTEIELDTEADIF